MKIIVLILLFITCFTILNSVSFADENYLEYYRVAAPDGGGASVRQRLFVDVSSASSIIIKADVKLINHTLPGSGWWSDKHDGYGEYPVFFWIEYQDENDNNKIYAHGVLGHINPNKKKNYHIVEKEKWGTIEVEVLDKVEHKPKCITFFNAGGNGWSFHGSIDNVEVLVDGNNIITNGDFSNGLKGWMKDHSSNIEDEYDIVVSGFENDEGEELNYGLEPCKPIDNVEIVEEPVHKPEPLPRPPIIEPEVIEEPKNITVEDNITDITNITNITTNDTIIDGNVTKNETFILELIGEDQLKITPEVLKVNPGILTVHINLPEFYNGSEITNVVCDYAEYNKISGNNVKFRREDIEDALAEIGEELDIHFEVWGTILHEDQEITFFGTDNITRVEEKAKGRKNYDVIEEEIEESKNIKYKIKWIIGQKEEEELREAEIIRDHSEELAQVAEELEEKSNNLGSFKSQALNTAGELRKKSEALSKKADQKEKKAKGPILSVINISF